MTTVSRIKTDRQNYCRYDAQCDTITASLYLSNAIAGDSVSVTLERLDGYGVVQTKVLTVTTNGEPFQRISLRLEDCFDPTLPHIYRARAGQYVVRAGGMSSPPFSVSLVSVRRLRDDLCKGLPLLTGETVGVQDQPRIVTGVTILQIQPDLPQDLYTLSFTTPGSLSWDGGTAVDVRAGGEFTLIDADKKWWVRVSVDDLALPGTNQSETLVVSEQRMTDADLLSEIQNATSDLQDDLQVFLEPTQVGTQLMVDTLATPDPGVNPAGVTPFVDTIRSPVAYQNADSMSQWWAFRLPFRGILQLESLMGFFNQTKAIVIDRGWWSWDEKSGMVQLVPSLGALSNWMSINGFFYSVVLGVTTNIPNFWHYKATSGLRELRNREAAILTALEYKAAINVLRRAALHAKPGYTSESLGRDGVMQNIAYGAGPGGVYAQTIESYEKWLAERLPDIKRNRRGIIMRLLK